MDLLEAGLDYLRAGLSIIALTGKAPVAKYHRHGLKDAISGTDAAHAWRKMAADPVVTGVGLVIPEHLCVVDIDGEAGAEAFRAQVGPDVPPTAVAKTSRGLHLWFVSPQIVRSTVLAEKLDLKGVGGYVVAPPSVHPDTGLMYEWLIPLVVDGVATVDWLPDPIDEIVMVRQQVYTRPIERAVAGSSIDALVRHLAQKSEGTRNNTLYWAACCARDDGFPLDVALANLAPASGLPDFEARRTIKSAYRQE